MKNIRQWLTELGLERCAARFEANDVDLDVIPVLADADLEKLGVSLGHRKRIALALQRRNGTLAAAPATTPCAPAPVPEPVADQGHLTTA